MRTLIAIAAAVTLGACSVLEDDIARTHDRSAGYSVPSAYMTADARIVTQRIHPVTHQSVMCVEPSPDAIKAISTSAKGDFKGGNGAATGELGLSGTSAEAAAEMAGRSTALLGLREGVFRACEAYANGIIGSGAYSLVLARYGQTMTTLFLAQDLAKASRPSSKTLADIESPAAPSDQPSTTPASPRKPARTAASTLPTGAPRIWSAFSLAGTDADGAEARAIADSANTAKKPKPKGSNAPAETAKTDASQAAGLSATAALALVRMNEDYMLQPQALIGSLVIACIEENDPTRVHAATDNAFLAPLCNQLKDLETIAHYEKLYGELANYMRFVEPDTSLGSRNVASSHR